MNQKKIDDPILKRATLLQERIDKILTDHFWPPNLTTKDVVYRTTHDDNEGEPSSGFVSVMFSVDGDAWIEIGGKDGRASPTLRYRMPITGGGRFPRVRNALLLLAEAIRQEGEDPFESA